MYRDLDIVHEARGGFAYIRDVERMKAGGVLRNGMGVGGSGQMYKRRGMLQRPAFLCPCATLTKGSSTTLPAAHAQHNVCTGFWMRQEQSGNVKKRECQLLVQDPFSERDSPMGD